MEGGVPIIKDLHFYHGDPNYNPHQVFSSTSQTRSHNHPQPLQLRKFFTGWWWYVGVSVHTRRIQQLQAIDKNMMSVFMTWYDWVMPISKSGCIVAIQYAWLQHPVAGTTIHSPGGRMWRISQSRFFLSVPVLLCALSLIFQFWATCALTWLGVRTKNSSGIGSSIELGQSSSAISAKESRKPPPERRERHTYYKQTDRQIARRKYRWTDRQMNGLMDGYVVGWMDGNINGLTLGQSDGRTDECIDGWTDGRTGW